MTRQDYIVYETNNKLLVMSYLLFGDKGPPDTDIQNIDNGLFCSLFDQSLEIDFRWSVLRSPGFILKSIYDLRFV